MPQTAITLDAASPPAPAAPRRSWALVAVGMLVGAAMVTAAWVAIHPQSDPGTAAAALAAPPVPSLPPSSATPAGTASAGATSQLGAAATAALKPLESVVNVVVRRNDTLDAIFRRLQLSIEDLATVRSLPGIRQSLDFLKPGDVVQLQSLNGELTALERRVSDTATLSVRRAADGEFAASIIENTLEVRTAALHGRITSSLFKTVNDLGASDQVGLQLAEVFRYDIDFAQELQPGDSFTVVLEKVWRDGAFVRDGEIIAAEFVNNGHTYRAVRYTLPDGRREYYTPDGKSLRKAFLLAPVQFSRISSGFGLRWHPILNRMRAHRGIDYAAPVGTPIRAAGDGRVTFRGVQGGYGNVVMLAHAGGVETVYGHMSRFAPGLFVGKRLKQGELIGFVGMTGLATGPHLHYEYRVGGVHRNPASIKSLPAEPLTAALRADFDAKARSLLADLDVASHSADVAAAR